MKDPAADYQDQEKNYLEPTERCKHSTPAHPNSINHWHQPADIHHSHSGVRDDGPEHLGGQQQQVTIMEEETGGYQYSSSAGILLIAWVFVGGYGKVTSIVMLALQLFALAFGEFEVSRN